MPKAYRSATYLSRDEICGKILRVYLSTDSYGYLESPMACTEDPNPPDFGTAADDLDELTDSDVRPLPPWQRPESRQDRLEVEGAACSTGQ